MQEWIEIDRPIDVEADIPLKDQASDEIKKKYNNEGCKNKFVAWVSESGTFIGCIKDNRSISVESSKATTVELYEMESAKGGGYVGLDIVSENGECLAVVAHSRYSQKSLQWLKKIQPVLAGVFNLEKAYRYHGKDV